MACGTSRCSSTSYTRSSWGSASAGARYCFRTWRIPTITVTGPQSAYGDGRCMGTNKRCTGASGSQLQSMTVRANRMMLMNAFIT